jgi:uncharacterized protein
MEVAVPKKPFRLSFRPFAYLALGLIVCALLLYEMLGTERSPSATLNIFSTRFLGIFIEAAPFLLLGTIMSGLIEAFIRPSDLAQYLPKNRFFGVIAGTFLGILFPVCECGVVPVARRLFKKGLPMSVGVTFLLAAPFMNPIVFASTYIAFGFGTVFIARFLLTALVAMTVGLVFSLNTNAGDVLLPASLMDENDAPDIEAARPHLRDGLAQALSIASSEFFEMGRFLVMGCLLAAALQTNLNQSELSFIGQGAVTSVLVMQLFAFILSVCSTVDSFLALAFVNTFSLGAIIAFLVFGPMVDVKSTMMFAGVFQKRAVVYLIVLPFLMNLVIGVIINLQLGIL